MLSYPDPFGSEARERHTSLLNEAAEWRLAEMASPRRHALLRRGARAFGHALVMLGVHMLRYGQTEAARADVRGPGAASPTLN